MKRPLQPLTKDGDGTVRFQENKIVRTLLDTGKLNVNDIERMDFSREDREQFVQLTGCSLKMFGELNYVSDEAYQEAQRAAQALPQ
jgi:hypothetical protein